ncbi:MAG: YfhO family protein [bacterium]
MANTEHRKSLAYLAATLGMVALFFLPALTNTFIFRDAFNLFYPYKALEAPYLRDLSVCLWNPWEVLGSSFVGELATGWFYPGNVFYMLFSSEHAYRLFIFSHFLMAAFFTWLWLREEGRSRAAASCGALAFTLSGYLLSQHGMPDMLAAAAWLPGSLWLLSLYLKKRNIPLLAAFGVSLAMPFLAGRAEAVLINGTASAAVILFSGSGGEKLRDRVFMLFKVFAGGGLLALLLSMVQFLPSFELGRLSLKGQGFTLSESTLWSFHPGRLLEFFLSSPWGRFWPEADYRASALTGWENHYPWALSHYLGLVMLAGAAAALFRAPGKKTVAVSIMLVAVIGYSAGKFFFIYPVLFKLVPLLHIFRYPEKYMVLCVLLLAACGAYGLDVIIARLRKGLSSGQTYRIAAFGIGLPLAALITVYIFPSARADTISWKHLSFQIVHAAFILSALAALALLSAKWGKALRCLGAGIMIICAFDLFLANYWIIPYADPEIFHYEPKALKVIKQHSQRSGKSLFSPSGAPVPGRFRVMREPGEPPSYSRAMMKGDYAYENLQRWKRHTLAPNFNFLHGIEEITGYTAAITRDYDRLMKEHLTLATMRIFNVHYLIKPIYDPGREPHLDEISADPAGFGVYRIPRPFPRAYMVGESRRFSDPLQHTDIIKRHDFTEEVILKKDPALPPAGEEQYMELTPAEVVSYKPTEVVLRAEAPSACYLVLSDSFYPGWTAKVDGEPARIYHANFLVRAVRLDAGGHEVVFKYEPQLYYLGRAISLATVLFLAGVFALSAWRAFFKRSD